MIFTQSYATKSPGVRMSNVFIRVISKAQIRKDSNFRFRTNFAERILLKQTTPFP